MKNRIICIKYITHCWCTVLSCNPILLVSRLHIMYGGMGVTQRRADTIYAQLKIILVNIIFRLLLYTIDIVAIFSQEQ